MPYNPTTAAEAEAANRLFNAQRTGEPEALVLLDRRAAAAAFRAHSARANDYANQLAADPNRLAIEAERQHNEIGNAHYSHA